MSIAYFDCFSGASGDMILGALVDCGLPFPYLKAELEKLQLKGYRLGVKKGWKKIAGSNISVDILKSAKCADYVSLDSMIAKSKLKKSVRDLARAIFKKLAQAEAKVHGTTLKHIHFHEVGATDSVVDVVGAAIGFDYFGFKKIFSSPLPITRGRIKCMHGTMPVPAPATLELLRGVPVEPAHIKEELVTPTGAAILTTVCRGFGDCPIKIIETVGYGFGDKEFPGLPNALRLMIGK